MEKPSGRHRKPVRGWVQQVRWLFGAVLAALLCSAVDVRQERRPLPSPHRRALEQDRPSPRTRPVTTPAKRARPGDVPFGTPQTRPVPGPVRVPRPRRPHPSEQGWCVDDDGVRGVRPYLFHHSDGVPDRKERVAVASGPGEFDELAAAVRTWLDIRR
ncbi:hypothetical protein ABZ799_17990 [Nocardiopsis dassonvillei]|uniref:hypothetical protein n=1 Tax=Nocardiopsis dassonvillei TaxID=2014 RepID=UPI0033D805FD